MSLESIISHILKEAQTESGRIILAAQEEAGRIVLAAQEEAAKAYQEILKKEESVLWAGREKLVVAVRLESKKELLTAKHELINLVFQKLESGLHKERFKKEQISQDKIQEVSEEPHFYLESIKLQYESEIANILFS